MSPRGSVAVRDARPDDADALVALDRALVVDGRGMVLALEQIGSIEQRRAQLEARETLTLVAEHAGIVIGSGELRRLRPARCAHVGILSLGVRPDRQRLGVGRALMHALIERARTIGLARLELYVRADNERAIALYRSCGFEHEGTRARFVRLEGGTLVDDWIMARFLDAERA